MNRKLSLPAGLALAPNEDKIVDEGTYSRRISLALQNEARRSGNIETVSEKVIKTEKPESGEKPKKHGIRRKHSRSFNDREKDLNAPKDHYKVVKIMMFVVGVVHILPMSFLDTANEFVILAATLALVNAGNLIQPAAVAYSAPAIAAYSSPAVYSRSISSTYQSHPSSFATYAAAAPVVARTYAAAAPAVVSSYSSPAIAAYSAPLVAKSVASPVVSTYAAAAPALSYAAAPALSYAAAPALSYAAAPAVSYGAPALAYSSPVVAKSIANPVVSSYAAPAW